MDPNIEELAEELLPKLIEAITVVMNPMTPQEQRHKAYEVPNNLYYHSVNSLQCLRPLGFETNGLVQIKTTLKTLKVFSKRK